MRELMGVQNGYLVTPEYPKFTVGVNLAFMLTPPPNFEYRIYAVDIAMSNEYILNKLIRILGVFN